MRGPRPRRNPLPHNDLHQYHTATTVPMYYAIMPLRGGIGGMGRIGKKVFGMVFAYNQIEYTFDQIDSDLTLYCITTYDDFHKTRIKLTSF